MTLLLEEKVEPTEKKSENRVSCTSAEAERWFNKEFNQIFKEIPKEFDYAVAMFRMNEHAHHLEIYPFTKEEAALEFREQRQNASFVRYRYEREPTNSQTL